MGCDGGTIPKRDELVRTKKKKQQCSKEVKNAAKWNNCHLSQQPLEKPIVADFKGFLYKKECLIEYLLDRSKFESGPDYVKALKDVKELNLTDNPGYNPKKEGKGDELNDANSSSWICSITGLEMNGVFKFYFNYQCGCVISERALKSVNASNSSNMKCIKCERVYSSYDLIMINPNEEEIKLNEEKLKSRKEQQLKAKLEKSEKNSASNGKKVASSESNDIKSESNESEKVKTKRPCDSEGATATTSASASAITAGTSKEKLSATNIVKSMLPCTKKHKSIQEDPNASDIFKSLFNTCDKAKNQQKAHWVSFNPQYF